MYRLAISAVCFLSLHVTSIVAVAETLPSPEGPVLLTVKGDIALTNNEGVAEFDRAMLEALGTRIVTTSTIWTEGEQSFEGTPLAALAARLDIPEGAMLRAVAVNEYATQIPYDDIAEDAAILAMERNGAPMSLRDKGPIWLIYPFDSHSRFRSETYHARSIWQLVSLEVQGPEDTAADTAGQ